MKDAFVEYKDTRDIYVLFDVLFGSQNVRVYVWRSVKGLKRNTNFSGNNYVGAYVANPSRKRRGLFGEIHLVKGRIGAGYVAHEIQHFLFDWLFEQNRITDATNEKMALLAGNFTRDFWVKYYKADGGAGKAFSDT